MLQPPLVLLRYMSSARSLSTTIGQARNTHHHTRAQSISLSPPARFLCAPSGLLAPEFELTAYLHIKERMWLLLRRQAAAEAC